MDDKPRTFLSPRGTVISMPHDMTEWKLVCLGLDVGLIEDPPSINHPPSIHMGNYMHMTSILKLIVLTLMQRNAHHFQNMENVI
jgi:hypothetical protein